MWPRTLVNILHRAYISIYIYLYILEPCRQRREGGCPSLRLVVVRYTPLAKVPPRTVKQPPTRPTSASVSAAASTSAHTQLGDEALGPTRDIRRSRYARTPPAMDPSPSTLDDDFIREGYEDPTIPENEFETATTSLRRHTQQLETQLESQRRQIESLIDSIQELRSAPAAAPALTPEALQAIANAVAAQIAPALTVPPVPPAPNTAPAVPTPAVLVVPPQPPSTNTAVPTPSTPSKFKPSLPEPFKGDRVHARAFLENMDLFFGMCSVDFPTDESRIRATLLQLQGSAAHWAQPIRSAMINTPPGTPLPATCTDWQVFRRHFIQAYYDPAEVQTAERALAHLVQRTSVVEYAAEWRRLIAIIGWSEDGPLQSSFYKGLKPAVKDWLADRDPPCDFEELITRAILCDNRQHARFLERSAEARTLSPSVRAVPRPSPATPAPPQYRPFPGPQSPRPAPPFTPHPASSVKQEPVASARTRPSADERSRRLAARLCFLCGQSGHFQHNCPHRPASVQALEALVPPDVSVAADAPPVVPTDSTPADVRSGF